MNDKIKNELDDLSNQCCKKLAEFLDLKKLTVSKTDYIIDKCWGMFLLNSLLNLKEDERIEYVKIRLEMVAIRAAEATFH